MTPLKRTLIASVSVLALGCGGDRQGDAEVAGTERFGGTAVIASIAGLESMNPLAVVETYTRMIQRDLLFLPLLRYDAEWRLHPALAAEWDTVRVAPDTLELTFHLRPDVRWHDGAPTSAHDVALTFTRAKDPASESAFLDAFAHYASDAVVEDSLTVRFRLRPHAGFLDPWATMGMLPAHLLRDVPPSELMRHPFGTTAPLGNGPFRFVRRVTGQEVVFEANDDFPEALGGRPHLDRVVYRHIPDRNTLLAELLTGTVDMYLGLGPSQAQEVSAANGVELLSVPGLFYTLIAWNGQSPMFDTPEERRALSMAIDRPTIVRALLDGHAEPGRATVTPAHWAFDAEGTESMLPYDTAAARALLARAGWSDRNGDGILEDPAGRPLSFELATFNANSSWVDAAQVVQAQLGRIGVDADVELLEGQTLIAQLNGVPTEGGGRRRDFDAVVISLNDDFRKDDSDRFHTRNLNEAGQLASFSDPRIDALLDTLILITDPEQARPLWREYQALMARLAPVTVLYYPRRLTGVRTRLQGVVADARGETVSVAEWWLAPADAASADSPSVRYP